jgi:hypothetical protein
VLRVSLLKAGGGTVVGGSSPLPASSARACAASQLTSLPANHAPRLTCKTTVSPCNDRIEQTRAAPVKMSLMDAVPAESLIAAQVSTAQDRQHRGADD